MRSGTFLGVAYRVHLAWLLIFALVIVSLATSVEGAADRPQGVDALLTGGVVVLLLLVGIVAHELVHAVVARRLRLPPAEIAIATPGRASDPEPEPRSPATELSVAAVGPLLSAAVGLALVVVANALAPPTAGPVGSVYWVAWWLGLANLLLAGFHLVPVLPLDGGRIVRAGLWVVRGDLDRASVTTAVVGRLFGTFIIGSGLIVALSADLIYGIWFVLLGWFAMRLSRAGIERRRMQQLTVGLTVDDATDRGPAVIVADLSIGTLLEQEEELGQGVYPVRDGDRVLGVVYPGRLRGRLRRPRPDRRVREVVVPLERTVTLRHDAPLLAAVEKLETMRIDGLPVVDGADPPGLVGVVSRSRVLDRLRARQAMERARDGSASVDVRG